MNYLAIDYGTKRVGLARSHEWLAEPLEVVAREKAVERVIALVSQEYIDVLVLGISEGAMAQEARTFGREVMSKLGDRVKLIEVDETLTSRETHSKLAKSSMSRNKRQQPIDHYAAAAFLQDFLDVQPH